MSQLTGRAAAPRQSWLDRIINGKRRVVPGVQRHLIAPVNAREKVHYRCWVHQTHAAQHRCNKCGRMFCDDCLRLSSWGHVCDVCHAEIERKEVLDRQWLHRVVFSRNWIPIGLVMLASLLMSAQLYLASNGMDLRRDLAVKMRLFFEGSNPENGVVMSSAVVGGRAAAPGGSARGFEIINLIDGINEPDLAGWRSVESGSPQDVVLRVGLRGPVARVDFYNHPLEAMDSYPRRVQILVADEDPALDPESLKLVHETVLEPLPVQFVDIPETIGRYVVVRVLENYGSRAYTSIGEVEVRGPRRESKPETQILDVAVPRLDP